MRLNIGLGIILLAALSCTKNNVRKHQDNAQSLFVNEKLQLTVIDAYGSRQFSAGDQIDIAAKNFKPGMIFSHWSGDIDEIQDTKKALNTFKAKNKSYLIKANYIDKPVDYSGPFWGFAQNIPGVIEAEEFDYGNGNFQDLDEKNKGNQFRSESPDIYLNLFNQYQVGSAQAGEFLKYSINVLRSGTYALEAAVANPQVGSELSFEIQNQKIISKVSTTGGWRKFQIQKMGSVQLNKGQHQLVLKFSKNGGGGYVADIDFLRLVQQ